MEKFCSTCLYWERKKPFYKEVKMVGACKKMSNCFCCNHIRQIAGAIGGGHFESYGEFSCNMWRIDTRAKK